MMKTFFCAVLALCLSTAVMAADTPKPFVTGLVNPESVCYGPNGLLYVTEIGEFGKDGDGKVTMIEDGKASTFATGLDDPKGIVFYKDAFYVTDKTKVVKIDEKGKTSVYADPAKFPIAPKFLNDIAVDPALGIMLVSDSGDLMGKEGAVFRINVKTDKIDLVASPQTISDLKTPNGVIFDGEYHFLLADFGSGDLYRVKFADKSAKKIASGMEGADALIWDNFGRLFITSWKTGKVFGIPRPGEKPILLSESFQQAADGCLDANGKELIIPDMKAGTLTKISTTIPGWEVDESPLAVELKPAFPNLKWTGWDDGQESGKPNALRPLLLTHANDGSNRLYVITQQGVIHTFENSDAVTKTTVFLDLSKKTRFFEKQFEEGLLGLAFHPKFKENGEFFVFYTDGKAEMTNILSRFRVKKDNPLEADPSSEEQLMRFDRPFWNHDGGTILFGRDGYLYVAIGDGGKADDPFENGQNLKTLFGKILRIDIDKKADGKKYGIPADNPFVSQAGAAPEIWAYGLRNPWRMAFDRKTGELWLSDVGQNLYEEICIVKKGANYGWNLREGLHPFSAKGVDVRSDLVEPIWEYHHNLGKSVTGGNVYRGENVPALKGCYLYADFVSYRIWALKYDAEKGRVVANHPIANPNLAVFSFGEDEKGETYLMGASLTGRGIYRFTKTAK